MDVTPKRNLFIVATYGDTRALESLSQTKLFIALYHRRDPFHQSLLHIAATYCQPQVVKFPVEADSLKKLINEEDDFCRTPTHFACRRADVNFKNIRGETALHYAARRRLSEIAELLVFMGADVKAKDKLVVCLRKGWQIWKKMHEGEEEGNRILQGHSPKDLADVDTSNATSLNMPLRRDVASRTGPRSG